MTSSPRTHWPFLVRFILWGVRSRRLALTCLGLCVVLAAGGAVLSYWEPRGLVGVPFLVGVGGYAWAIRWVDSNGGWS